MLIKRPADIPSSEITDKKQYLNRRDFIRAATGAAAGVGIFGSAGVLLNATTPAPHGRKLENVQKSALSTTEKMNSWNDITTYNNYYEFGTDKDSPSRLANTLRVDPWSVVVDGECNKKATYHLEDILKGETLEERIYRHRCVERWSMVIPWVGFPLANLIKRCEPTSKAKFVTFTTLADPGQMPGVRVPILRWPYVEGLRMDEAMHPLTILAVGLYGEVMPKQDGASRSSRSTPGRNRRPRNTDSIRT
jgi:sulfoxide reductase catalytic subunit YedY